MKLDLKRTCLLQDWLSTSRLHTVNQSNTPGVIKQTTTYLYPRVSDLLDYSADDLTGKSMYSLVHAGDVDKIKQTHVDCKWQFRSIVFTN